MTALAQTALTTTIIRNALGEDQNTVLHSAQSPYVNKWSRYKPLRTTTRPGGDDSKYGFNLPTNWDYLQPRGLANNEGGRMGDFRGYEHDKDVAGPVIYCLSSDIVLAASIFPTLADNTATGEWKHKCNQSPHNSVQILPSDLGYTNYYCGVHLTVGTLHFYKTGAQVNAIGAGGQVIGFDARITNLNTKAFEDFPSVDIGTYTWELFISSTQHSSWTQTTPTNYVPLPGGSGETYGSKTIKSTSTFVMNKWLIAGNTSDYTTNVQQLTWAYNSAAAQKIRLWRPASSIHPGLYSLGAHWTITLAEQGGEGGNVVTNNPAAWDDGTAISITPVSANNGAAINQDAKFGFEITHPSTFGDDVTIQLVHENGTPPSASWTSGNYTLANYSVTAGLSIGSTSITITTQINNAIHGNIPVQVYRNSVQINSVGEWIHKEAGVSEYVTGSITISQLQAGDEITINIGNAI